MTRTNSALQALEDSIVRVMTAISPEHYFRICHINAMLSTYALSKLTGVEWVTVAGSMQMRITPEGEPPVWAGMDSSKLLEQLQKGEHLEFHCWVMLTDLAKGTEVNEGNQHRVFLADFSARFWDALWAAHGDAIQRPYPSPLVGHPFDLIDHDILYRPDTRLFNLVLASNLEAAADAARLWDAVMPHYGLDQTGTGFKLMQEIIARCQALKAGALAKGSNAA